ncbi:MAG: T9SS type A sorting domain-containing protein [Bacteroidales bacterium]|nr:T9SS type A sorting domain-containing protein [Bacteroidales bacterium]
MKKLILLFIAKCKTIKGYKIFTLMMLVFLVCVVSAQEMRVEPNTNIKVESGTTLDITGGNLVLKSDATGDASLIDYGSVTYSGGGQAKVHRYRTKGAWHLISSPVSNALTGMFTGDYLQYYTEHDSLYHEIEPTDSLLKIMEGYALWSIEAAPATEVFLGLTNTGVLSKAFTNNFTGWNLFGNPYPSVLDWDIVSKPAELRGSIQLYDPTLGTIGEFRYYIKGGGAANTTSQYVPLGQGFFVRVMGVAGVLTFDNSCRVHTNEQAFYKNSEDDAMIVLKATGNSVTTQTAIRFNQNSTQKVDRLYDVYKLSSGSPDVPVLFTVVEDENMAINTLPSIEGNEIMPMWFRAGLDGEYSIKATETETFNTETPIYLLDIKTGIIQNLREIPEYTFDYKWGGDRSFLVYFTEPENSISVSDVNIYAYGNVLNINFPVSNLTNPDFNARIMVFDLTGKAVLQTATTEIYNQIPLKGDNSIYIVKVVSNSQMAIGKVFIK